MGWFGALAIDVVFAVAAIVGALWLGGWIKKWIVGRAEAREIYDETLFSFLGSIVQWALLGFAIVFVLAEFGVQTASIVAVIGAAGLAIGLALQGTLSNLAAGVMLVIVRPIKVDDYVEVGSGGSGTVEEIGLFFTRLKTPDNLEVFVPNSKVFNDRIVNYSTFDTRRVDLVFGVSYKSDLKEAEAVIRKAIEADERIAGLPEPFVKVTNLGDSSVDFTTRVWVERPDYFNVKADLTRAVKDEMDAAGIDIPFPTRTMVQG